MFENIIGHAKQKQFFITNINNDSLLSSYIFVGSDGIGKRTFAMELSKNILKTDNLNSSADFKYITKDIDKKNIAIDQLRDLLINNVYERPISGDKKVYIIDDAHLMTDQAQNAILKTFEEPPEYVVIILIANSLTSLKDTIISRALKINFEDLDKSDVEKYILSKYNKKVDEDILEYASMSIGKIDEAYSDIESYNNITAYVKNMDKMTKLEAIRNKPFTSDNIKKLIDYMQFILLKRSVTDAKYAELVLTLEKTKDRLNSNCNYDIVLDNMILEMFDNIK